jgi:subtilisin family serine protease
LRLDQGHNLGDKGWTAGFVVGLGFILLSLTGCGDDGNGGGGPDETVASVAVSPANHAVAIGSQVQYTAVARNGSGNPIPGKTFTWESSQQAVAAISSAGLADALAQGMTSITATTDGVSGESELTVSAAIPVGATIQGTITLSGSFLAPRRPMAARKAIPDRLGLPAVPPKPLLLDRPRPASPVRWVPVRPWAKHVPGEWIVSFRPAALGAPPVGSPAYSSRGTAGAVAAKLRDALAPYLDSSVALAGLSPAVLAARVRVKPGLPEDSVADQLRRDPAVRRVERNFIVVHSGLRPETRATSSLPPVVRPNDPLYPHQAWHYEMVDLTRAWRTTTGSTTVLVAVVDDGIRFDHPGIVANLTSDGYDFTTDFSVPVCAGGSISSSGDGDGPDGDPTQPLHVITDPNSGCVVGTNPSGNHGLHVAGTIGAVGNDGGGVAGVSWTVRIRPVRVLGVSGAGSFYDMAQGLLYAAGLPADDGAGGTVAPATAASIINLSLGGPTTAQILQDAVTAASSAGALLVAAAGNSPSSVPNYPGAYPEVVSVASLGPDAALASYSSFGPTIDLSAPGGDIPDGDGSYGVMSTAYNYVTSTPIYDNSVWMGTSMATPHVTGVAALILAANPGLTAAQLRTRLETFAGDLGAAGRDDQYGFGVVNGRNALTQSTAASATLRVRLINSATGAVAAAVAAQPNGSYRFNDVAVGSYFVYAGQDEEGDGVIGVNPRRWGAHGGSATPAIVSVTGPGTLTVDFTVGFPLEVENNDARGNADVLPLGGYLSGTFANPATDVDVSRVQIPANGTYTFETGPVSGACGLALEEDTILELLASDGTQIAINDDIDSPAFNYCSRITTTLSPGTYFLRVAPFTGPGAPGFPNRRYTIAARSGP